MNKKRLIAVILTILVLLLSAFLWWALIRPTIYDDVVNEAAPTPTLTEPIEPDPTESLPQATDEPEEIIVEDPAEAFPNPRGSFTGSEGHEGIGSVSLIGSTLRFEEDFRVTNGPDLYVYIGDANGPTTQVARLKGNVGSQNYDVSNLNVTTGQYVWIYCVAFKEQFAKAQLQ